MSKSLGNAVEILADEDTIRKQVMSMVTDTQRIKRTDPGRPEVCNVCQLHRFFGDDYEYIWDGERTARTGCVDTKKLLADRIDQLLRRRPRAGARARVEARLRRGSPARRCRQAGADGSRNHARGATNGWASPDRRSIASRPAAVKDTPR